MPDPWAWREAGALPRAHSELVTGPQSTPQASPFPASSPFLLPLVPTASRTTKSMKQCLPTRGHPHPSLSSQSPFSGCTHPDGFSAPEKAWVPTHSLVTQDHHQETCTRLSHPGEAYTGNSSRMLLRDSGALSFPLMGIPRSKRWTIFFQKVRVWRG